MPVLFAPKHSFQQYKIELGLDTFLTCGFWWLYCDQLLFLHFCIKHPWWRICVALLADTYLTFCSHSWLLSADVVYKQRLHSVGGRDT